MSPIASTLLAGCALVLAATGCSKEAATENQQAAAGKTTAPEAVKVAKAPTKLTVEELDTLLKSDKKPVVFDANSKSTRSEYGTIPGATLLSSTDYDVKATLPASKEDKLVFYCSSTRCSSAGNAASKALAAGYGDVSILPQGIKGWSKAGKNTSKI